MMTEEEEKQLLYDIKEFMSNINSSLKRILDLLISLTSEISEA